MPEYICHRNNDFYILIAFTWLLGCRHTPSNNFLTIVIIAQEAGSFKHVIYSCILKILYKPNDFPGTIKFLEDLEEAKTNDTNL